MFVKKFVEKASKKSGGSGEGLKPDDVDPRLVFHYGIPSASASFAYDSVQKILALSTKDGRIKLFGKENTQALLESCRDKVPSKFLLFMENQGFILNVTANNLIEVWDIDKKRLSYVHDFKDEITSFTLVQNGPYMLVGDSAGNVSVLKLEQKPVSIVQMKYTIPFSSSHGNTTEANDGLSVAHLLLQLRADTTRLLIIFSDGLIVLWGIRESKLIFTTGGKSMLSLNQEAKKVTAACWGCPFGSKVIVGYSNGEILIWNILPNQCPKTELTSSGTGNPTALPSKLNLGYKLDKTPISSLRWVYADGKASRLYVVGASEFASPNSVQVVLLNEYTESRTVKLGLQLLEACSDLAIISSFCEQSKNKQDLLLLLGKSGCIYAYDNYSIEKYLLQSQSSVAPSLPKEVMVKMPFIDSTITVAKIITENTLLINNADEDYRSLAKTFPPLFLFETKPRDSPRFRGFSMVDNMYITGHSNGAVTFWDASCPLFVPILSLHQQSEDDFSLSGIAVTALHFDANSRLLVSGDQSGMVRIFRLRPESFVVDNSFMPFQGSLKKNNYIVQSVNLVKVAGSILVMNINHQSTHLAVGSDQGIVAMIDIKESNIIYQKHIASGLSTGIISVHFERCSLHGFEKNILVVATKDSSIFALDDDTGSTLSAGMISPKKPSRALFMQILGEQNSSDAQVSNSANQLSVLLCSEKAAYVYSFSHAIQGVKKVQYKKKFQSSCCWASTFDTFFGVGLVLLFNNGKTEVRSLPALSLVKETSFGGVTYSASNTVMCSSRKGDIVVVNSGQELFVVSVLIHKEIFRLLDSISHIYRRDLMLPHEKPLSDAIVPKEKKRGIFNSVMKEVTGNKAKQVAELGKEDSEQCTEDLSMIFSTDNFLSNVENRTSRDNLAVGEEDVGLDIDDIELDDSGEKHKEQKMFSALNKQKLAGKFNAFKGKLKHINLKSETNSTREEELDRKQERSKTDSIDQIKRKYGYASSDETSIARMTESKLHENLRKLQGINERATEMQGSAKSFSSMASEMLRIAQQGRRNSS